ncbi:hypothetical protein [Halostella litorea]|uniref:hypothetical protein n=1 Tax=Halostella litorea TaxID=2528831 RepID=UPI0010925EC5|nr:hypothetical protein [Halostella litorea]
MPSLVSPEEFCRTYRPGTKDDTDAWDLVRQYRKAMTASLELRGGDGERAGSQAVSSHLDLPRSRVRTWVDNDGKPDAKRGLDRARKFGWIDVEITSTTFEGLNTFVAQTFAGGGIESKDHDPGFALPNDEIERRLKAAAEKAGFDYRIERRRGRADELRASPGGTILGRVLIVLGAPVGRKTQADIALPNYLDDAPQDIRLEFAKTYVLNRAAEHDGKDTLTIIEDRPQSYRDELAAFLEQTIGERVTSGKQNVTLSADAARAIV